MKAELENILDQIRTRLEDEADEKTQISAKRYFKESIKLYGVKNGVVHKISKDFFKQIKSYSKEEIFEACEIFWQSGYMEEAIIACDWSYFTEKLFSPKDFNIFYNWIENYITNWATCDTFCNHTMGALIHKYPELINSLMELGRSNNRWVRRAMAVSLIMPARRGYFLNEIFTIAEILLTDTDDMVQKGYGWMLKAASEKHQKEVFDFVVSRKSIMPRTALRYAIEKMPAEMKLEAMKR